MAKVHSSRKPRRVFKLLGAIALVLTLVLLSQRALAEALGLFLGGLVVGVMDFLLRVVGMVFSS